MTFNSSFHRRRKKPNSKWVHENHLWFHILLAQISKRLTPMALFLVFVSDFFLSFLGVKLKVRAPKFCNDSGLWRFPFQFQFQSSLFSCECVCFTYFVIELIFMALEAKEKKKTKTRQLLKTRSYAEVCFEKTHTRSFLLKLKM